MNREEALKEFVGYQTYDIQPSVEATKMAIKALEQEPCEDCISRQAVLDILKDKWNMFSDANDAMQESIDTIETIPSVIPQPKTGHWIEIAQYSDAKHKIECSECGNHIIDRGHANSFNVKNKYKYCPNCGCRMESEGEEWKKNFQM